MHLFIDTNILLNFYHFSKDSLDELQKVFVLQSYGKVSLWATEQVQLEYSRNRETKIADALKKFLEDKPSSGVPHVARGYPECDQLQEALKQFNTSREKLLQKVKMDISEKSLVADKLIQEIFAKATKINRTDGQLDRARRRSELRNPPGKNGSLGDAINWEALLEVVPDGEDLALVSEDGDFASPLDTERLSDFLAAEWESRKKSKAVLFTRTSQFLSTNFPAAKVAVELEKDLMIADLAESGSFSQTHSLVAKLGNFASFTSRQAIDIAAAFAGNKQVNWIVTDPDVQDFGQKLAQAHDATLTQEQKNALLGISLP